MSTQPSLLTHAYTCGICRQTFSLKGPPIIGEQKEARLARVGQMLAQHVAEVHKNEHRQIAIMATQIQGWMLLDQYAHNDQELAAEADKIRKHFRRITRRVDIPDATIEKQVDSNLDEEMPYNAIRKTVVKLLQGMRNVMDETPAA